MAGSDGRLICPSAAVIEGGDGVRFSVTHDGATHSAFAIRYRDQVHAYLNRCAHRGVELDWVPGRFFDRDGRYLICATHGALYEPGSGRCAGGPCGGGLVKLAVIEKNSGIYLVAASSSDEREQR